MSRIPRPTPEQQEAARRCTFPGCMALWSSDIDGRLCLTHRRPAAKPVPVPSKPSAPHWQDDGEVV